MNIFAISLAFNFPAAYNFYKTYWSQPILDEYADRKACCVFKVKTNNWRRKTDTLIINITITYII